VELTVCQKNVTNALNSVGIVLKNKVEFLTLPFLFIVKLQNFLNAPRMLQMAQAAIVSGVVKRFV